MAIEDLSGGMKPYARPFNLVPPPHDRQFRTRRSKPNAQSAELNGAGRPHSMTVRPVTLSIRLNSLASGLPPRFRDLRADLPPHEVEKLHHQLASVLSGETPLEVWHATVAALREARRAADFSDDARPRKWRQVFPDGW